MSAERRGIRVTAEPQIWSGDESTGGYKSDVGNYLLRRDVPGYLNNLERKAQLVDVLAKALAELKGQAYVDWLLTASTEEATRE